MPNKSQDKTTKKKSLKRVSKYDKAVADKLLAKIANGKSVRSVCDKAPAPSRQTFYKWAAEIEEFKNAYEAAITLRADYLADDILKIADDSSDDYTISENPETGATQYAQNNAKIQRDKLKIDARKWLMAKMHPTKYGEHLKVDADNNHSGELKIIFDESYDTEED